MLLRQTVSAEAAAAPLALQQRQLSPAQQQPQVVAMALAQRDAVVAVAKARLAQLEALSVQVVSWRQPEAKLPASFASRHPVLAANIQSILHGPEQEGFVGPFDSPKTCQVVARLVARVSPAFTVTAHGTTPTNWRLLVRKTAVGDNGQAAAAEAHLIRALVGF